MVLYVVSNKRRLTRRGQILLCIIMHYCYALLCIYYVLGILLRVGSGVIVLRVIQLLRVVSYVIIMRRQITYLAGLALFAYDLWLQQF